MSLLVIDRDTVHELLPMAECIDLMREAMVALSTGKTRQTLRQIIPLADGAAFGVMPGAVPQVFGAKLISVFPGNFALGLQSHQGFVALFDPVSGGAIAMLHAGELTAIRTAAASAAATRVLARADAHRLAILGYGEQAETHARAMAVVRPLSGITLWGRAPERVAVVARRLEGELSLPVRVAETVREAAAQADIICAVSAAREPILAGDWLAPGTHVNLVGSSTAATREADDALVVRGRLFADHREGVLAQGGEVIHAIAAGLIDEGHVLGEIGEVMAGSLPGRRAQDDITIYKSLGAVVQDLFSGWHVYQRALAEGRGVAAPF
ncbi:MAG TPA: ornithine cyclodeaminase family protein [Caulobacteraceae bacterium]|nr:ornithine cyclodeaminase family protein [Caulobacteraceae bacterium]